MVKQYYILADDSNSMGGGPFFNKNSPQLNEQYNVLKTLHDSLINSPTTPKLKFLNNDSIMDFCNTEMNVIKKLNKGIGGTPLCKNFKKITSIMNKDNDENILIIISDDESTDGDLGRMIKDYLTKFPNLRIIVRIIGPAGSYWDNLDKQYKLDLDVIENYNGEAKSIKKKNSWLTYTNDFHNKRILGIYSKKYFQKNLSCNTNLADIIDERSLTFDEMKIFIFFYVKINLLKYDISKLSDMCRELERNKNNSIIEDFRGKTLLKINPVKIYKYYYSLPCSDAVFNFYKIRKFRDDKEEEYNKFIKEN